MHVLKAGLERAARYRGSNDQTIQPTPAMHEGPGSSILSPRKDGWASNPSLSQVYAAGSTDLLTPFLAHLLLLARFL